MKLDYIADYDNGQLKIRGRKQFDREMQEAGWQVVRLSVSRYKAKRSEQQSRYYWGCIIPILQHGMKECGHQYSKETVHEMMRAKFLTEDAPINNEGEFITRIKSTTELNKEQFGDYIESISAWAIEYLGITIPAPSTQTELI